MDGALHFFLYSFTFCWDIRGVMKTKQMTTRHFVILENGIIIEGIHPVGSLIPTQWGPRKVVSQHVETFDATPDCPHGC